MKHKIKNLLITLSTLALVACNGGGGSSTTPPTVVVPAAEQFSANIANGITNITNQNQNVTGLAFPTATLSNLSDKSLNAASNIQAYILSVDSTTYVPTVWTLNGINWESYNISNADFTPETSIYQIYATTQGLLIGGFDQHGVAQIYLFNPINGEFTLYATPQCEGVLGGTNNYLTVNNGDIVTMVQNGSSPSYPLCISELNNKTWTTITPVTNTGLPNYSYYLDLTSINNKITISGASNMYGANVNNIYPSILSYTATSWVAQSTPPKENGEILLSSTQNKFNTIYTASLTNSGSPLVGTSTISKYVNGSWSLVDVPFLSGLNTNVIKLYPDNYGNIYATISYYPVVNENPILTTILVESAPQ